MTRKLRVAARKELFQAIEDERKKELQREVRIFCFLRINSCKQLEHENKDKPAHLKEIVRQHKEARRKAELYINALQTDNEVRCQHLQTD